MAWKVVIAHAEGEEHHAERLADVLSGEGYEVAHRGTVLVGESFTEAASKALTLGGPVVVCGTIKAAGTRWARTILRSVESGHVGRVRVFPVRLEAEADLEALAGNVKVADCHRDFRAGVNELLATLHQHYPIDERPEALEHSIEDWADVPTKLSVYDVSVLERFREELRPHIRERLPDSLDARSFLRQAGLLGADGCLTRAGALIIGERPELVMPSARVACTHYNGVGRTAARELVPVLGPLPTLIRASLQFLTTRMEHREQQTPGVAEPTIDYEYPMIAVREILANAFCHRRYDDHARHVHVRLFADRIEVASPGEWAGRTVGEDGPIELDALVTESVRRNARLASVLAWARLVEEEGSGVPRAVEDCRIVGARPPTVEQRDGFTVVSIWPRIGWRRPTLPEPKRFDYSSERQRHEKFVGRVGLLAQLDQLLVDSEMDRWVVVTGGPGMGKSALLAAWLARREATGAVVPHHFIRRGAYDWDDPAKLVGSLVAQIDYGFPDLGVSEAEERMHPATRLARALSRVSENVLRPRGEHLVVLIDGLDEYDPPAGSWVGDPLAAFLPEALPAGVRLLCANRPRHPYVSSLEARDGELVRIDLDDPDNAADNDATVHAFWERVAAPLGLDEGFIAEAVARAGGNVQHAVQLQKRLAVLPPVQRRVEDIPRGLAALIEKAWGRIAVDAVVVSGLGILCAAREALTLDELGAVAGWTGDPPRWTFERAARELLVETLRPDGSTEYRLHHDSIRAHIAKKIGTVVLYGHHRALARQLATWPCSVEGMSRRYALRHALIHRAEAGDWVDAWRLAADMSFLEAKCRELGVHETEADVTRLAQRCRASGDEPLGQRLDDLARALARESHWLRAAPEATAALLWNRLRRSGWSASDIDGQIRVPNGTVFLHVRHAATRESPALVRDLVGHTDGVRACAVTPDGRRVVSPSADWTLKVWDLDSGRALATLQGHTDGVRACAVTPDGRRVVSASADRMLKVWDLDSGRALTTLEGHTDGVTACVVSPDGQRVVSASSDRTLRVWDLESRRTLATLEGHTDGVTACAVTPDGRRVVSASSDRTLRVWDLESRRTLATLEGHTDGVTACAVTPDGRRVVSASSDRTLKVWDLDSGRVLATLEGHTDGVTGCAVTPDGRRVVSASSDQTLKVWDLDSGRARATLQGHTDWVTGCAVPPDGRRVVSASVDRTLKVWDLDGGRVLAILQGHTDWVTGCAVTPDGQRVVSASVDQTLKVWGLDGGCVLATLQGHTDGVTGCAVTPDGQRVVSASVDQTLKVWDLDSGRVLATLQGHTDWVTGCAVALDGRRVVSASSDRTLKVWDLDSCRALATLQGHTDRVTGCAATPDGRRVVSASVDRTLKVWDLDSRRVLATLQGHTHGVTGCTVTPDGQRVVSASVDRTLKVWDLGSGRALATLQGHTDEVTGCAVTPDGRRVVSTSVDRTLKVWDLKTYVCLVTHRGDAPYNAVAATPIAIVAGDSAGGVWFLGWSA